MILFAGIVESWSMRTALLILIIASSVGCATVAKNDPGSARPGVDTVFAAGERQGPFGRTYRLFVPSEVTRDGEPRPLVIALHGGVATARIFAEQSGFSDLAEEHGFYVLYPNGIGVFSAFRHWNAGWCCAKAAKNDVDDIGYVERVFDQVAARWPVDRNRVFVVGYSNGGMLAHAIALEWGAERLAGSAAFAGPVGPAGASRMSARVPAAPIPTLVIHGTADERLSVDGSLPDRRGNRLLGARGSAEFWAEANGCREEPEELESDDAWTRLTWCAEPKDTAVDGSGRTVQLDLLEGWGHDWPGPKFASARRARGLDDYDAATEIIRFFGLGRPGP